LIHPAGSGRAKQGRISVSAPNCHEAGRLSTAATGADLLLSGGSRNAGGRLDLLERFGCSGDCAKMAGKSRSGIVIASTIC